MTIEKQIQKAANKKANQLAKEFGLDQVAFQRIWNCIEILYPSADTWDALTYATSLHSKRNK